MVQIFIASSSEQLPIARQIETALREPEVSSVKVWDEAFDFSQHCMDSLEAWLDRADFAVVVLTAS
jgi:predicted nucleotide-binding protein